MTPARRRLLPAAVLLATLALSAPSLAQQGPSASDKETARALMDKGDQRMDAADYAAAGKAYLAADTLMHLPMTGVAVARAQAAAGLLLEARDKAMAVARLPPQPDETPHYARARAEAAELATTLAARIPSVQVVLDRALSDAAGVIVTVDGVTLPAATAAEPRKVNPGAHVISVSAPGFATSRVEVTVSEGAVLSVPMVLQAAAPGAPITPPIAVPIAPPGPRPSGRVSPLAIAGFTVGGASLVAAAITGGLSLSKTSALKKTSCNATGDCGLNHDPDLAAANTLANVSNVTVALGVAGVGLGVVGLILSRPREATRAPGARVEPLIGPGAVGLRGTF